MWFRSPVVHTISPGTWFWRALGQGDQSDESLRKNRHDIQQYLALTHWNPITSKHQFFREGILWHRHRHRHRRIGEQISGVQSRPTEAVWNNVDLCKIPWGRLLRPCLQVNNLFAKPHRHVVGAPRQITRTGGGGDQKTFDAGFAKRGAYRFFPAAVAIHHFERAYLSQPSLRHFVYVVRRFVRAT